ncbi:MAG: hypothetical protein ACTHMS_10085 [Jatrophihabitans sp.]|uniref:hypothetical protein n=1 Tax=Jatrophihabitans sp. TaxID=1932789 RepID=UPI003F80FCA1
MKRTVRSSIVLAAAMTLTLVSTEAALAAIPYGPGPQRTYTVQPQPAPGTCHYRHTSTGQPLPDVRCNPGALNPKVRQSTLAATICHTGYTTTIRPPESVTEPEKKRDAAAYHYTGLLSYAEYDHLISLELGGDPNSPKNLWVEPPSPGHTASQGVRNPKDSVENWMHTRVCYAVHLASKHQGSATYYLPLARAQQLIDSNWTTAKTLAPRYYVHA